MAESGRNGGGVVLKGWMREVFSKVELQHKRDYNAVKKTKKRGISTATSICNDEDTETDQQSLFKSPNSDNSSEIEQMWMQLCEYEEKISKPSSLIVSIPISLGRIRIAHHSLLECSSGEPGPSVKSDTEQSAMADIGGIVWAKAPQMQAWPGKVVHYKERDLPRPSSNKVWVEWYGDYTVSLVNTTNVWPIKEGIGQRLKRKATFTSQLKAAILEALQEALDQLKENIEEE